jgi:hypothetical protein
LLVAGCWWLVLQVQSVCGIVKAHFYWLLAASIIIDIIDSKKQLMEFKMDRPVIWHDDRIKRTSNQ